MIMIEKAATSGFEPAVRGMRNSFNSWSKSDSDFAKEYELGPVDVELMKKLAHGGPSHAKYRRFINVTLDITAPLYWWKEFDTYKVGTVANSCSTMHTIAEKKFAFTDFSCEHLLDFIECDHDCVISLEELGISGKNAIITPYFNLTITIKMLNKVRYLYLKTKDKKYWWQMIQLLPSSYNQKRTVQLNYEVLRTIYNDRKNHKLDEWQEFCKWIESLPYAEGIIFSQKN